MPAKIKQPDYSNLLPDDPDASIHGARAIAMADNLVKPDGTPEERKAQYPLERAYYDADQIGRQWRSTVRRIRSPGSRSAAA